MDRDSSLEKKYANFIFPNVDAEIGEVERVAAHIGEDKDSFTRRFEVAAHSSTLAELSPALWAELTNSESFDVHFGAWDEVATHAAGNHDKPRNWEYIKLKMLRNERIDAPIVVRLPGELHLVSGNTRLMVAKALGKLPKVLLVDLS